MQLIIDLACRIDFEFKPRLKKTTERRTKCKLNAKFFEGSVAFH